MRPDIPLHGLYAITDPLLCGAAIIERVAAALDGGARVIQYRDKSADDQRRLAEASALACLCRQRQALFIVNDDIELAAAAAANGVHLGRDDGLISAARARLGDQAIIGVSCYAELDRAQQAKDQGADYLAFGRFFPSHSKPDASPAEPQLLSQARRRFTLPLVAIGGVTPENGRLLIQAGADLLAVIQAVFGQADVAAACRAFQPLFKETPS